MEWLILALVSWILLLLLADRSTLKRNVWGGLAAVLLQMLVDNTGVSHGLYEIHKCRFCIFHSSFLYTLGPVFSIGILLAQYQPKRRLIRILNVIVLAALHTGIEIALLARGNVVYRNWHFGDSIGVNIAAMILLSWFAIIVLDKGGEARG